MNDQDYSVDDFINDPSFVNWVKEPDASSEKFWVEFLKRHPEKAAAVQEARELITLMVFKDTVPDDATIIKMKSSIDLALLDAAPPAEKKPENFWRGGWLRVAAVFLFLLVSGGAVFFFWGSRERSTEETERAFKDDNNRILRTARGKRTIITLDDGSRVWLNADSRIAYNNNFGQNNLREVFLDGEAFFDVAEDKTRPFIVNTTSISVKVLGTAFNVRSFKTDSTVQATLLRGKISLSTGSGQEDVVLHPNQQAVYVKETKQIVLHNKVDPGDYTSWKNGQLNFKDETFENIMHDIERWYDVKIVVESDDDLGCRFSAKIDNKSLEEVLELFKAAGPSFEYRIEGREVTISGKFCDDQNQTQ
jgi:transmembrane sensor